MDKILLFTVGIRDKRPPFKSQKPQTNWGTYRQAALDTKIITLKKLLENSTRVPPGAVMHQQHTLKCIRGIREVMKELSYSGLDLCQPANPNQ